MEERTGAWAQRHQPDSESAARPLESVAIRRPTGAAAAGRSGKPNLPTDSAEEAQIVPPMNSTFAAQT